MILQPWRLSTNVSDGEWWAGQQDASYFFEHVTGVARHSWRYLLGSPWLSLRQMVDGSMIRPPPIDGGTPIKHGSVNEHTIQGGGMIPVHQIIWHEFTATHRPERVNEPSETMDGLEQVRAYVKAYEWGGPTSALQLHHIKELSLMIRPGATILDLACGPGPLLLELAELYPDCHFIGADLSPLMLEFLQVEARARGLSNVTVLLEDIRVLPSLAQRKVDLVISTSALHHLPSEDDLRQVFARFKSLLNEGGGFYIFDFALLKSDASRRLLVQELSKLAPPLTTHDYDMSLRAAFPLGKVLELANEVLPRPFVGMASLFVDFFFFLQTPKVLSAAPAAAQAKMAQIWRNLSLAMKVEYLMLRAMRRVVARR